MDEPEATLDKLFSPASPRSRPPTPPLESPTRVRFADVELGLGESSSSSRVVTPKNRSPPPPALVGELPLAWDAALDTFEQLDRCVYERKDLGLSREQDEMMVCDCVYDPGEFVVGCIGCPKSW